MSKYSTICKPPFKSIHVNPQKIFNLKFIPPWLWTITLALFVERWGSNTVATDKSLKQVVIAPMAKARQHV